ncbi:MAG: hypothetical protein AB7I32_07885 [Gammaproteobacteria bacterium]
MVSPQARALALEGSWHIEFDGIVAAAGVVDIENRLIVGASSSHHIRGDFRLSRDELTVSLQLRGRAGTSLAVFLLQMKGSYHLTEIALAGETLELEGRAVFAKLHRARR